LVINRRDRSPFDSRNDVTRRDCAFARHRGRGE